MFCVEINAERTRRPLLGHNSLCFLLGQSHLYLLRPNFNNKNMMFFHVRKAQHFTLIEEGDWVVSNISASSLSQQAIWPVQIKRHLLSAPAPPGGLPLGWVCLCVGCKER